MTARRAGLLGYVLLGFLAVWVAVGPSAATSQTPAVVGTVDAIGITVADLDRSLAFYRDLFGFVIVSDVVVGGDAHGIPNARRRLVRLRLGDETIELVQWLSPAGRPMPVDSRSNDRWFQHIAIIVNDMDQAYLWLQRHKVAPISPAPQRLPDWNPGAGGIRAFYFRDPDGHPLEVLEFPPGKGDPKWRRPAERVFLGIDHTAIVVADTDASLRFYRDTLGLRVMGRGENWGPEQERLNNVVGARVRITTLRAPAGPGIELLEYVMPRDGRRAPADARANDLAHWHTIVTVDPTRGAAIVKGLGLVRDPDGHAVELRAR